MSVFLGYVIAEENLPDEVNLYDGILYRDLPEAEDVEGRAGQGWTVLEVHEADRC